MDLTRSASYEQSKSKKAFGLRGWYGPTRALLVLLEKLDVGCAGKLRERREDVKLKEMGVVLDKYGNIDLKRGLYD